jgi:hypothetical protein
MSTAKPGPVALIAAAAVFAMAGTTANAQLNEELKLTALDAAAGDRFGNSVALTGSSAVVGAPGDFFDEFASGTAYTYNPATGQQIAVLIPNDGVPGDWFGSAVATDGFTVIVGARGSLDNSFPGPGALPGAAHVFFSFGIPLFTLTAIDGEPGDQFGNSVAASDGTFLVGAPGDSDDGTQSGSVYVFDGSTQLFKLTASDAAMFDGFGISVAISGDIAIIGAWGDSDRAGAAYIFDVTTGQELFKLTASDAAAGDQFGFNVAISGSTALVGATDNDDNGSNSGSAYVFDVTTGQELFKLTASDAAAGDRFGSSVGIAGTKAVIGARGNGGVGAAYVFDTTTGQEVTKLTASDSAAGDNFGWSVGIDGDSVIAGAISDDDAGTSSGSAYVFDLTAAPECPGDIADDFGTIGADGMVSFGDFLALLGLVGPCPGMTPGCDGDIADDFGTIGPDGMVSFGDFLALLGLVGPCP